MIDKRKLSEAANRLRAPEFTPFIGWLARERDEVLEHLALAPAEHIGRLQGDAARLKKILDLIEGAPAALDRMAGQ